MSSVVTGRPWSAIREDMRLLQSRDTAQWRTGRAFGVAYCAGMDVLRMIEEAYALYALDNGRHHHAYPSLKRYEDDIVAWTARLFGNERAIGNFVTGGTEGIFLAVKTARDRARRDRGVSAPEIVVPATAYPIWYEVGHYLDVKVVTIPIDPAFRADVAAMRAAMNANTVLIMGSAPGYAFGVMDPIESMSSLALEFGVHLHVDACVGGYQLPYLRKLGRDVPPFDFTLPGVTSIGADLHKYGYCAIGSSVIVYRDAGTHRDQGYEFDGWRSGKWLNAAMLGSRPGGAVAAAWAVMNFLGDDGYLELTRKVIATSDRLRRGIEAIPGLRIQGNPDMSVFTYVWDRGDIAAIADGLRRRHWFVRPSSSPPSMHMVVTPMHEPVAGDYLADLREIVEGQ
jgi:glutamate/tyrosine decarboxylase-like PLP-dependent enzyme